MKTRTRPSLKDWSAFTRSLWYMSPWIKAAENPSRKRYLSSSSVSCFRAVNTITLWSGKRSSVRLRSGYLSRTPTRINTWSIVSTVGVWERMSDSYPPIICVSSILVISRVYVAENVITCLMLGIFSQISITAAENPISIIWSTSSMTSVWIPETSIARRSMRSIRRPGVAMMTWGPALSPSIWRRIGDPPNTAIEPMRISREILKTSSRVCIASSRVGSRISTCGFRIFASIVLSAGMTNAAVFPEPVWDWTTIFFPSRARGITSDWTLVGSW